MNAFRLTPVRISHIQRKIPFSLRIQISIERFGGLNVFEMSAYCTCRSRLKKCLSAIELNKFFTLSLVQIFSWTLMGFKHMTDTRPLRTQARTVSQQTDGLRINRRIDARDLLTLMHSIEIKLLNYRNQVKKQETTILNQAQRIALLEKQVIRQTKPLPKANHSGIQGLRQKKLSVEVEKFGHAETEWEMPKDPNASDKFRSDLDQLLRRIDHSFSSCSRRSAQVIDSLSSQPATESTKSIEATVVSSKGSTDSDYISSLERISVSPDTATFRFWFWPSKSTTFIEREDGRLDSQ